MTGPKKLMREFGRRRRYFWRILLYMMQVANSIKKRMKDLSAILKFVASRFTNGQVH